MLERANGIIFSQFRKKKEKEMPRSENRFPKFIHVTRKSQGTYADFHISGGSTAEDALKSTTKTQVATYELKEVKEGKLEPVFSVIIG